MDCELIGPSAYKCEWRVQNYSVILDKCKPKQKITSPVSEELPIGDCLTRCRFLLFPKGASTLDNGDTSVVVQFSGSRPSESSLRLTFSCLLRCVSDTAEIIDDLVESGSCVCGEGSEFGPPATCTFLTPDGTSSIVISVTFRLHAEEKELLENVRSGIFSFQTAVSSFMATTAQAAGADNSLVVVGSSSGFSEDDAAHLDIFRRPPLSEFWSKGRWSVLLHVCCAFNFEKQPPSSSELAVPVYAPSDSAKQMLFEICPPLRSRVLEVGPDAVGVFWGNLLNCLQRYSEIASVESLRSSLRSEEEASELLDVLLFAVDPSVVTYLPPVIVADLSKRMRDASEMVLGSEEPSDGVLAVGALVQEATELKAVAVAKQNILRDRLRALVGYHTWHVDAEQCLVASLESATVDPLSGVISAADRLCEVLCHA